MAEPDFSAASADTILPEILNQRHYFGQSDLKREQFVPAVVLEDNVAAIRLLKTLEAESRDAPGRDAPGGVAPGNGVAPGRDATDAEKSVLARYAGWGGLPKLFALDKHGRMTDKKGRSIMTPPEYTRAFAALYPDTSSEKVYVPGGGMMNTEKLMNAEEWKSARASVNNAHFTSPDVISAMWDTLLPILPEGELNILEPSAGVGSFLTFAPPSVVKRARFTAVELDNLSARILRKIHPDATVFSRGFEDCPLPANRYDLVISNVPFGNYTIPDRRYGGGKLSIHNYFFERGVDLLKPNGVMAAITSRYSMDSRKQNFRERWGVRADLLQVIRMPSDSQTAQAGCSAVEDIIVLRRLMAPRTAIEAKKLPWMDVVHVDLPITEHQRDLLVKRGFKQPERFYSNAIFELNPEWRLGEMVLGSGNSGIPALDVEGNREDLGDQMRHAMRILPEAMTQSRSMDAEISNDAYTEELPTVLLEDFIAHPDVREMIGTVGLSMDGEIMIVDEVTIDENSVKQLQLSNLAIRKNQIDLYKDYLKVRDALREVFRAARTTTPHEDSEHESLVAAQMELNRAYDWFYEQYGAINKYDKVFVDDNQSSYVMSIEDYDVDLDVAQKRSVFSQRTFIPVHEPEFVEYIEDAVSLSINKFGQLDVAYMASKLRQDEDTTRAQLLSGDKPLAFIDPAGCIPAGSSPAGGSPAGSIPENNIIIPAYQYISGNLYAKIKVLDDLIQDQPEMESTWATQRAILKENLPDPISMENIQVSMGADWIPVEDYHQFFKEALSVKSVHLGRNLFTEKWEPVFKPNEEIEDQFGTQRMPVVTIIEKLMNHSTISVMDTVTDQEGKEHRVPNPEETMLAAEKATELTAVWDEWVRKDADRSGRLEKIYNERFGGYLPLKVDGSGLNVTGMNPAIHLRDHQNSGVTRAVLYNRALFNHEVGTGKTYTQIAAGIKLLELGLSDRAIFVVPKSTIRQFAAACINLFPNRRFAVMDDTMSGNKDRRRRFLSGLAVDHYDAVILNYNSFASIALPEAYETAFYNQRIQEIDDMLSGAMGEDDKYSVKGLERMRKEAESRLKKAMGKREENVDRLINAEDMMGKRPALFVDEFHNFKNAGVAVPGSNVTLSSSARAMDMKMKSRFVTESGGRFYGASGTPVANHILEFYVLQDYFQPEVLEQMGVASPMSWYQTYITTETEMEPNPASGGWRIKERPYLMNPSETVIPLTQVMDTVRADDAGILRPAAHVETRPLADTPFLQACLEEARARLEDIREKRVTPDVDNVLSVMSMLGKATLDPRMLEPNYPVSPDDNVKMNHVVHDVTHAFADRDGYGLQLIFCDMGIPKRAGDSKLTDEETGDVIELTDEEKEDMNNPFCFYDTLVEELVASGIPRHRIATVYDVKTDAEKEALMKRASRGDLSVLLGSTSKMGIGINIQEHITDVRFLTVPWRPDQVEQSIGRAIRQGNLNSDVNIVFYTQGQPEAYRYRLLDYKSTSLRAVLQADRSVRKIDLDSSLNYNETMALTMGNPLMAKVFERQNDLDKLTIQRKAHFGRRSKYRNEVTFLRERIAIAQKSLNYLDRNRVAIENAVKGWPIERKEHWFGRMLDSNGIGPLSVTNAMSSYFSGHLQSAMELSYNGIIPVRAINTIMGINYEILSPTESGLILARCDNPSQAQAVLEEFSEYIATTRQRLDGHQAELARIEGLVDKPFDKEDQMNSLIEEVQSLKYVTEMEEAPSPEALEKARLFLSFLVVEDNARDLQLKDAASQHGMDANVLQDRIDPETLHALFPAAPIRAEKPNAEVSQSRKRRRVAVHAPAPVPVRAPATTSQPVAARPTLAPVIGDLFGGDFGIAAQAGDSFDSIFGNASDASMAAAGRAAARIAVLVGFDVNTENLPEYQKLIQNHVLALVPQDLPIEIFVGDLGSRLTDAEYRQVLGENLVISHAHHGSTMQRAAYENDVVIALGQVYYQKGRKMEPFASVLNAGRVPAGLTAKPAFQFGTSAAIHPSELAIGGAIMQWEDRRNNPLQGANPTPAPAAPDDAFTLDFLGGNIPAPAPVSATLAPAAAGAVFKPVATDAPAIMNSAEMDTAILQHIIKTGDSLVQLARDEASADDFWRYGNWQWAVRDALQDLASSNPVFARAARARPDNMVEHQRELGRQFHALHHNAPDQVIVTAPATAQARPEPVTQKPLLRAIPPAIRGFLSNSQRMATEHGLRGEEREYFSNKMRELEQVITAMPRSYETDGQGDNAPVTLHYFKGQADWYITEKDIDPDGAGQTQAFGLADLGMGYPEMGYISIQELVQAGAEMDYHFAQRTLLELKREKYPEMIRDRAPENVPAPNLSHEGVLFYRGGPDTSFPAGKTIEDIIDYERNELENDIHIIPENMDYQRVLPVASPRAVSLPAASLQWVTDTKEEAEEYGTAQEVWFNDPVVIARDPFGGMLVGERKDLDAALLSHNRAPENTPAPDVKGDPALSAQEHSMTPDQWQAIHYEYKGNSIHVDETQPPFNGDLILIHTPSGMIEVVWTPLIEFKTMEGEEESEGFCWSSAKDVFNLDNDSIRAWHPVPDSTTIRPLSALDDFAPYREEKPVLVQHKEDGWVEAWFDHEEQIWQAMDAEFVIDPENITGWVPLPVLSPERLEELKALTERDAEAPKQSQNTFFTGDVPKKEGQTIAEMITRWGDSGITVLADDRVTPYLQMPSNTGSLRVLFARHPDELQQEPVTEVEYKQPVILATLPENAVLVAEQSYLDAYRSTSNPVQDTQENTLDTLASWITPDQMIALRNALSDDAHTDLPHTMSQLDTMANRLRDPLHFGPGNRPISTPRVAEIQAGAGLNIMTYRSPDSLHWWFITGMDQDSGLLYGLQMVRSRPDSRWEAQMGPVSRQDLLDAGFLLELMQDTPFVVADRMHEMAPYIGGVDALPANGPTAPVDRADATVITPVNAATDLKIMEQIVFDSRIPASGHTIGDMLGDLRENGVNLVATSDVIDQYFYMERSESVRVVYSGPVREKAEPLKYHDPVTLAVGPDNLIMVAEREDLDAYLAKQKVEARREAIDAIKPMVATHSDIFYPKDRAPEIPASVTAIMSATDQNSLMHKLTHADQETVQDTLKRLQQLDQWLQHAPDVQSAQVQGLRGSVGLMLWNPENSSDQVFLSGISKDRLQGYGVRFYGEPTEFEAETLSLHNRIGSWALRLDVPQDTLQGVRAPQGVGTLQGVADAHVAPYRLKAWGKQAASVLKNGINTRRHVLVFAMNGDYPTVYRTEGSQTWTSTLMPVTDSDAIQVKSAWGEQAYPDLRSAVRETLDALEAPVAELRARMPATVPVSTADRNLDRKPEAVRTDSVMMQLDRPTHTNVWATPDLEGRRIVLRTPPPDQIPSGTGIMPNQLFIGLVESVNPTTGNDARITMQVTHQGDMDNIPTDYNAAMERVTSRDADYQRMHFPASMVTMDDGISEDIEAAIHAADQRYAVAHPLIPTAVARFMGDTQKERIATLLNGPDGNTSVMLSPDNIRAQLERLNRWAGTASITVMEDAEANGLNATGQMALRNAANGDLMFVCALSDDDATGYGLILQTMTHRATLKIVNLTDLGTDTWILDLTHEAQPLLDILAHQGYSQRDVTVERMVRSTISAPAPEMVRIEKAGLSEMAQGGPSYQSAIETIESAGGWDAVTDSPALQKSLQDQLDHLIQLRAEQVSQVLQEGGWKWSGAAFSRPDAENSMGFKIFPNGRSAGGNMVHWGYRITQRDGETPVSLDIDDDMTLGAADLVQSMLQRMEPPQPVVDSPEAVRAIPSDGKPSPEMQNHLDVVRPFVSESQFNGIRNVLSGESGIEAVQSEALHLERLAQWITQPSLSSSGGLHTNGGHLRPDDAAMQSVSATCVLAYQNQSGSRKTYLTGMDDLGNLYGIRIRTRAIAGPVNLMNILNQGELLNLTMQPTPVAELLKEDGYFPEGVFHEPAVTAIHEPYRAAIARTIPVEQVQSALNVAVAAMPEDWTSNTRKIRVVERALRNIIPDNTARLIVVENLKTVTAEVEKNREAETVKNNLIDSPLSVDRFDPNTYPAILWEVMMPLVQGLQSLPMKITGYTLPTFTQDNAQIEFENETTGERAILNMAAHKNPIGGWGIDGAPFLILRNIQATREQLYPILQKYQVAGIYDALRSLHLTDLSLVVSRAECDSILLMQGRPEQTIAPAITIPGSTPPLVIGLQGDPGAGKDTVADMLVQDHGFLKLSFGDVLYQEVAEAFRSNVMVNVNWLKQRDVKDTPQLRLAGTFCGNAQMYNAIMADPAIKSTAPRTPREILQRWGDYRRSQNPDYLINSVQEQAKEAIDRGQSVVVADLRKHNEVAMVESLDGVTVRIENPNIHVDPKVAQHNTETELRNVLTDLILINDGSLGDLRQAVNDLPDRVRDFVTPDHPDHTGQDTEYQAREDALFHNLLQSSQQLAIDTVQAIQEVAKRPDHFDAIMRQPEQDWMERDNAFWNAHEDAGVPDEWSDKHGTILTPQEAMADIRERFHLSDDGREASDTQQSVQNVLRYALDQIRNDLVSMAELDHHVRSNMPDAYIWSLAANNVVREPTLDDYVLTHIRDKEEMVIAQAKNPANRFEHFMEGRLMGAVSNAMMDVLNNPDIPQSLRDEARQIFQGPQGMTDYRAHIGRMVFDGERAGQSAIYSVSEDAPGTEVITPSEIFVVQPRETAPVTDPLLDRYVIAHVREHATPELLDQLNARTASDALPGLVADALVSARNDINLSFGLSNLAREMARSDSFIIDYAKVIGSMAANVPHVENTRNPTPALPAESPMDATLDAPVTPVAESSLNLSASPVAPTNGTLQVPDERFVSVNLDHAVDLGQWPMLTDAQMGFWYDTKRGHEMDLSFATSRGMVPIMGFDGSHHVRIYNPEENLSNPVMQRVILPLLAAHSADWGKALVNAGISLREIALPSDTEVNERMASWLEKAQQDKANAAVTNMGYVNPAQIWPHHQVILLDGVNQSAQGAFDGFSADHHQLLLKQEDGNILAVQHPNIDDWRTTGMFNGKGGWAGDRDEAKAIEDLQANLSTVSIRTATNQGDGRGPVPIVLLAVNGEQRSISFVSHLAKIQKHQRERAAAFDALVTHYAGNDRVLISLPNPLTDQQGDKTMTVTYVLGQHDCQIEVTFKDIDANSGIFSKRTARALLLENGKDAHWADAAEANIRDPQQLIRDLEGLRDAAMAEITLRTTQEPLIQAYIDSYITAADRIEATLKAVIRDTVQDQASAAFAYHAVDEVIREVQHNVIAPAADALRAISTNQQISNAVNERLSHDTRAQRHSQALRDARDLHDELFALAKTRTAERGKAALTGNNENTPIEDVAVAIFNKHGIETPVTPKIVSLVQNRDVDGVQSAIGYNSMNPASQEVFEHMTGIKLAKTQKKRVEQIDAWAGITPEQRQAMESEKSAQRQAREANRELERTWESLKHMNMRGGDNGQDFVLAIVKEGHTQATSYKKGASTQYGLLNSETQSTRFIQKNRDFNDFCKAIVMMDPNGDVLVALQKAGLVNAPQLDAEQPAIEVSPEVAGLAAAQEQIRLEEKADLVKRSALSAAEAEAEAEMATVPGATVPDDAELSDMDDEIEDGDYSPVPESEKSPLPVMKMAGPDMLSPLWDMKIPATWPNEHGVLPEGYHAEWSFDKGRFDKAEIDIARDQTGKYRFSTSGGNGSYAPSVSHGPDFDSFMDAHNAARQELMEGITKRYQSSNVERGFVQAAPKLLARIAKKADGDRFQVAHSKDMLQDPPYKNAFGEIMEQLSGDQRVILQWGYDYDRASNGWMVTLHHDENEQGIVAELRQRGNWDFEQAPEYAQVVDPGNPDAWAGFIQRIAQSFPEQGRTALFNAPYGLNQEPVWHILEPLPAQRIPDQPPAPHWPEDIDHDDLPVEAPGSLKNFDRYVGLRFEDGERFVFLAIARDKQGYVPAISYRAKGVYGPTSPNARSDHFPTFASAYAQGRKMLKAHIKQHEKLEWTTDADRAAKDWLSNKVDAVQPIFFGYDAARMDTVWDRQSKLEGVTALQLTHTKKANSHLDDDRDSYTLQGIVPGESKTRYINDVDTLDRALLLVDSTFALLGDASPVLEREGIAPGAAVFPMDVQMAATISDDHSNAASLLTTDPQKKSEHLQRAESIVSDLKEQFGDLLTPASFAQTPAPEGKSPLQGASPLLHQAEQIVESAQKNVDRLRDADKPLDAKMLETMFGSDEALGVRFVDHQGNEIPATEDADGQSVFPDDTSAITCTNYALQIRKALPDHVVQIVGFENEHNPDCAVVREDWHPDGHDFAIVDHRWLVDPWARLVAGTRDQIVYDLQVDARLVAETYGDPLKWETTGENRRDMTDFSRWDRTGLDVVIEAYEAIRLKAAGITITEAAIIPTRAGIVAVPKDDSLPVYYAGEPKPAPVSASAPAPASWLAGIPEDYREPVAALIKPYAQWPAIMADVTLSGVRVNTRILNASLKIEDETPANGADLRLHARINADTRQIEEHSWQIMSMKCVMNDMAVFHFLKRAQEKGLYATLETMDVRTADYGHVVINVILNHADMDERISLQGLQPLRLFMTVEPFDASIPHGSLILLDHTDQLVQRIRGWREDFQNTPVSLHVLAPQGMPEGVLERLQSVAENVRVDPFDPEMACRKADLTVAMGNTCEGADPFMGRIFRSNQKKDLVKPMLVYQSAFEETRLENRLPDVLHDLHDRNGTNARQMDRYEVSPLPKTLEAIRANHPDTTKPAATSGTMPVDPVASGTIHENAEKAMDEIREMARLDDGLDDPADKGLHPSMEQGGLFDERSSAAPNGITVAEHLATLYGDKTTTMPHEENEAVPQAVSDTPELFAGDDDVVSYSLAGDIEAGLRGEFVMGPYATQMEAQIEMDGWREPLWMFEIDEQNAPRLIEQETQAESHSVQPLAEAQPLGRVQPFSMVQPLSMVQPRDGVQPVTASQQEAVIASWLQAGFVMDNDGLPMIPDHLKNATPDKVQMEAYNANRVPVGLGDLVAQVEIIYAFAQGGRFIVSYATDLETANAELENRLADLAHRKQPIPKLELLFAERLERLRQAQAQSKAADPIQQIPNRLRAIAQDTGGPSRWEDSADCAQWAVYHLSHEVPDLRGKIQIMHFDVSSNPVASPAIQSKGQHDFLWIADRYAMDPWAMLNHPAAPCLFDEQNESAKITNLYGDRQQWHLVAQAHTPATVIDPDSPTVAPEQPSAEQMGALPESMDDPLVSAPITPDPLEVKSAAESFDHFVIDMVRDENGTYQQCFAIYGVDPDGGIEEPIKQFHTIEEARSAARIMGKPVEDRIRVPETIFDRKRTHAMTEHEQRIMQMISQMPQAQHIPEERAKAWAESAAHAVDTLQQMMAPYLNRDATLREAWARQDSDAHMVRAAMTMTENNIHAVMSDTGMRETTRRLLLMAAPYFPDEDTVREIRRKDTILNQVQAQLNMTRVPALEDACHQAFADNPLIGVAPDAVFYSPAESALILINARSPRPRSIPNRVSTFAETNLHAAMGYLQRVLAERFNEPADRYAFRLKMAYDDLATDKAIIRDVAIVPGLTGRIFQQAQIAQGMAYTGQVHQVAQAISQQSPLTPQLEQAIRGMMQARALKEAADIQEKAAREAVRQMLPEDPRRWPQIPNGLAMGKMKESWSRDIDENRAMEIVQSVGINPADVRESVWNPAAMAEALRGMGVDVTPYIVGTQLNQVAIMQAMEVHGIPQSALFHANPTVRVNHQDGQWERTQEWAKSRIAGQETAMVPPTPTPTQPQPVQSISHQEEGCRR